MHGAQKTSRENDRWPSRAGSFLAFSNSSHRLPFSSSFIDRFRFDRSLFGLFWFFETSRRNESRYTPSTTFVIYENRTGVAPILVRVSLVLRRQSFSATRCLQNVSTSGADAMAGIRCGRASFRQNLKISFGRARVGQLAGENLQTRYNGTSSCRLRERLQNLGINLCARDIYEFYPTSQSEWNSVTFRWKDCEIGQISGRGC